MIDNEIIKALECCTIGDMNCPQCPYKDVGIGCVTLTLDNSLDLINRQNSEIERLKKLLDEEEKKYNLCAKRFYKEGVVDFAEQVKMAFYYEFDELIPSIMSDKIDELVREMEKENES